MFNSFNLFCNSFHRINHFSPVVYCVTSLKKVTKTARFYLMSNTTFQDINSVQTEYIYKQVNSFHEITFLYQKIPIPHNEKNDAIASKSWIRIDLIWHPRTSQTRQKTRPYRYGTFETESLRCWHLQCLLVSRARQYFT